MSGSYKAVFLIPALSNKILDEDGWIFESSERLNFDVISKIQKSLNLNLKEEYCGTAVYVGDGVKASVIFDDNGQIEQIYLQIYGVSSLQVIAGIKDQFIPSNVEVFVP
jgi:hypothetical protein